MSHINQVEKIDVALSKKVLADGSGVFTEKDYDYLILQTADITPGMPIKMGTGAKGSVKGVKTAAGDLATHIVEIDKRLRDNSGDPMERCDQIYKQYALVPCIRLIRARGVKLRNILLLDPNSNIEPNDGLCAGALGCDLLVEPTLATEADNMGFAADAVLGANGASGTNIRSREILRALYYDVDPTINSRIACEVV